MVVDEKNIKNAFDLFNTNDSFSSVKFFARGEENDVYKIFGKKETYVMRLLRDNLSKRTKRDLVFEKKLEGYLRKNDIPIPIRYDAKKEIWPQISINDKLRYISLHQYIKGRHIKTLKLKQVENVGKLLGRIHTLVKNFKINIDRLRSQNHLYWLDDVQQSMSVSKTPVSFAIYRESVKKIKRGIKGLKKYPLHNDIHQSNLLFRGNKVVALLDFEECHKHYIPLELGWTMGEICQAKSFNRLEKKLIVFLQSYAAQNIISRVELELAFDTLIGEASRIICKATNLKSIDPNDLQKYKYAEKLFSSQCQKDWLQKF